MSKRKRQWYLWGASLTYAGIMLVILLIYYFFKGVVPHYNSQWTIFTDTPLTISHWWDILGAAIIPIFVYHPILIEYALHDKGMKIKRMVFPALFCSMFTGFFSFVISLFTVLGDKLLIIGPIWSLIVVLQMMIPITLFMIPIDWLIIVPSVWKKQIWEFNGNNCCS